MSKSNTLKLACSCVNENKKLSFREISRIRKEIEENLEFGFNLDVETWVRIMKVFSIPQTYGKRGPNFIKNILNAVAAQQNSGGDLYYGGLLTEVKTSISSEAKKQFNYRQVRLYEPDLKQFMFVSFDPSNMKNVKVYCFLLTKEQMEYEVEVEKMGSACHKRKKLRKDNEIPEIGIHALVINSPHFKRWCKDYRKSNLESLIKSINK